MSGSNGRNESSPSYDWYPRDFWGHKRVAKLSPLERDCYRTLLDEAWLHDGLTAEELVEISECRDIASDMIDKIVRLFFVSAKDGRLRNGRLEREREVSHRIRDKQRAGGVKGAEKRWVTHRSPIGNPQVTHGSPITRIGPEERRGEVLLSESDSSSGSSNPTRDVTVSSPSERPRERARGNRQNQKLVDWFADRFQELRGVAYLATALDYSKTATLLKKPGVTDAEWQLRAERMLQSSTQFHYQSASPRHLADYWNQFAVEIRQLTLGERRASEMDAVAQRTEWDDGNA